MKTLLKILGILLVLLVVIAVLVPMFVSTNDITDIIAKEVEKTTGRTLSIDGEQSLSVFPSLALQLNRVRFANSAGGSRADMATIETLDVHIPWMSLFSGELSVDRFVINNPDILLEIDAAGNPNWDLLPTAGPAPDRSAGAGPALPSDFDIKLGNVAIYGGRIRLLDQQAGTEQLVEELDLVIGLPSLKKDLALEGAISWMGEVLDLNITLATPARVLGNQPFDVALSLDSRLIEMSYRGTISEGGGRVEGSLEVAGDSVKELAAWQGVELEGGNDAYTRFALAGTVNFADDVLMITGLQATLDALEIQGESTLRLADTPDIRADIDLGMLNINPYLPEVPEDTADTKGSAAGAAGAGAKPQAVTWDDAPIDLSALTSVNAEVALRASGLQARDITLGENQLQLSLQSGKLSLGLNKFQAYRGEGSGSVKVDARRRPYKVATDFNLTGINAQPLLSDAIGFDMLLGNGQLQWQLQTSGASQADFVKALDGTLGFKFLDGAIKGANIAAMVRGAQGLLEGKSSGLELAQGFDEAQQTDFSELGGTLAFSKGVGRNDDMAMSSPLLRVAGKGKVDLPRAKINYGLTVRLVSTIEGQGASKKAKGVAVPVRIKGPFHKLKIELDAEEAIEEKAKDTIKKELLKRFGKKG